MRILLIEDDKTLGDAVRSHLLNQGFAVDLFDTLVDSDAAIETAQYSVVLLDLSLPDGFGLDFLKRMRKAGNSTPVLIATARDRIAERIEGLNSGADDYLVKPYDLNELVARIRAAARRGQATLAADYENGTVTIDLGHRVARKEGKEVVLTAREWAVLDVLISLSGTLINRADMESKLYDFGAEIESNSIEVFVSRIRKKLGRDIIKTERGLGYRMGPTT